MKRDREASKKLRSFTARIDEGLVIKLKLKAVRERTTVQRLVAEAIADRLKKKPRPEDGANE